MLEKEGNSRAVIVNKLRSKSDRLIGSILLGNTLVNILSSSLITYLFTHLFGEWGVVYATFVMTLLLLVFGEIIPKTYALNHSSSLVLFYAPYIHFILWVLKPLVTLIEFITNKILYLFNSSFTSHLGQALNDEELRGAIDLYDETDLNPINKRAMLRGILDLKKVYVEEIMTHRKNVVTIDRSQSIEKITDTIISSQFSRLPVWENHPENIIGVLHEKTLLKQIKINNASLTDIYKITNKPWFIPETTSLFDQLHEFRKRREHFALVVDEYGTFMGIVTLEDILEEIVGDITDESDVVMPYMQSQKDGSFIVEGTVTIRDLNREYDWNLPDTYASTLAGLLMYEAQSIPEAKQILEFYGFKFKILKKSRNQIRIIQIFPKKHLLEKKLPN